MTCDAVGGVWTYALELARCLGDYEVEVVLATLGPPPSAVQREEAARIPNLQLVESTFKLEWMEDPWEDVRRSGEWLLDLEKKYQPDIVHLNGYAHGALAWTAPKLIVAHSCVVSWWKASKREPVPASWVRYRAEIARGLSAADLIIAPSRAMLQSILENYGPFGEWKVIYNGRDPARFLPRWKGRFLLIVGRLWDEAKNLSLVEKVAPRLPWPVYAAGEKKFFASEGVPSKGVRVLGGLSPASLAEWYGRAPIFILPAWYEPFGLSALEAGLSGCALVLGDIASLREIWADAAMYVNPGDPQELEFKLKALIRDDALRGDLSTRSRKRALEYGPRRMTLEYFAAYQALMDRKNSRLPRIEGISDGIHPPVSPEESGGLRGLRF